jgi:DNA-binding LacI/PurR family transcriptional regulator
MARGRFGNVALLLSTDRGRSNLPGKLLDGIHDALAERELHLTLVKLPDEKLTGAGFVPRILREWSCDGLLVNYTDRIPQRMIDEIDASGHLAIWVNTKRDVDCVHPDDEQFGRSATEHLLRLGHRRIAYFDVTIGWARLSQAHYSRRDRQRGYEAAMRGAGLTPRVVRHQRDVGREGVIEAYRELLEPADRPEGIVFYGPPPAAFVHVLGQLSLRVPRDVSHITFGESSQPFLDMSQTMIMLPERQVGLRAVELLVNKIEGGEQHREKHVESVPVPSFRLIEGETCRQAGN